MTGTKASFLDEYCRRRNQAYVRFDYFGHGASSGDVDVGTIGRWSEDAIAVVDALTEGPQILIGSSMGGWIMLLVALARIARICGLVGIAAAPDFTEDLVCRGSMQCSAGSFGKPAQSPCPRNTIRVATPIPSDCSKTAAAIS